MHISGADVVVRTIAVMHEDDCTPSIYQRPASISALAVVMFTANMFEGGGGVVAFFFGVT